MVVGNLHGHVGNRYGYERMHGGHSIGKRNAEEEFTLDFAVADELQITNTFFKKDPKHLLTYSSSMNSSQIDFILYPVAKWCEAHNATIILGEECALQHRVLMMDVNFRTKRKQTKTTPTPRIKWWKLKDHNLQEELKELLTQKI